MRASSYDSSVRERINTPTHLSDENPYTESANGGVFGGKHAGETDLRHGILGDALVDGVFGSGAGGQMDGTKDGKGGSGDGDEEGGGASLSTTQWLARRHDVKGKRVMYSLPPEFEAWMLEEEVYRIIFEAGQGTGLLLIACVSHAQVSSILHPLPTMGNPIQMVLSPRRPHSCPYHGILLYTHVSILRLQSRAHTAHQRSLFFRLQPVHLRAAGQLSANGRGT